MTDIANKLHIPQNPKKNLENDFNKNEEIGDTFKNLPSNPEEIMKKAAKIQKQKAKEAEEKIEKWEITNENLLNKPNMTAKDKEWMQKTIEYLVEKKMDTPENCKKLFAINYAKNCIEIWGVKRARQDITAKPNGKTIFQHNNVTYFQRSEEMIKEQNTLLAKQSMEIPLDSFYEKSMKALPGEYNKWESWYEWWNILALITDMSMSGYCTSVGTLNIRGKYGYRWSASPKDDTNARNFKFHRDGGNLDRSSRSLALPVRPVLK